MSPRASDSFSRAAADLSFLLAVVLFFVRGRDLLRADGQMIDIDDLTDTDCPPSPIGPHRSPGAASW